MKVFSELQALFVAVAVSSLVLIFTFSVAFVMRGRLSRQPVAVIVPKSLTAEAQQGRHLFLMNCAHCHGDDAHGDEGPDLYDLRKNDEKIHGLITNGIKGEMPSFAKKLNDNDIRALTAFLRTLRS